MLAYCTALGLDRGHLVYAQGNERPIEHLIRNTNVTVCVHTIDLDRPPSDVLRQVVSLRGKDHRRNEFVGGEPACRGLNCSRAHVTTRLVTGEVRCDGSPPARVET